MIKPKKSYNRQAYSAALYKAVIIRGVEPEEIKSPEKFKELFPKERLLDFQLKML